MFYMSHVKSNFILGFLIPNTTVFMLMRATAGITLVFFVDLDLRNSTFKG